MPVHKALCVKQLANQRVRVLENIPYPLYRTPFSFYVFPKVKITLKGTHYLSMENNKAKTEQLLTRVTSDKLHRYKL